MIWKNGGFLVQVSRSCSHGTSAPSQHYRRVASIKELIFVNGRSFHMQCV